MGAKRLRLVAIFLFCGILIAGFNGCGEFSDVNPAGGLDSPTGGGYGGGYGVTPGGSQDMDYIRALVAEGRIPHPDLFLPESIFSEYDLPLVGDMGGGTLNVRASAGYSGDPSLPGHGLYVQMGFSSNIDPETFARPDLNLSIVLDRSGSMGTTKMEVAKRAVDNIIDELDGDDILSIVLFDNLLETLLEPTPVEDTEYLHELVSGIGSRGSTNMDIGLRQGYDWVLEFLEPGEHSGRVILITDALPNTGDYSPDNFNGIVADGAEAGVGLTAVGVGLDFQQELIEFIATQHGANYYYLNTDGDADLLFDEEFEFMVTPVVYDFRVEVQSSDLCTFTNAYGFPGEDGGSAILEVSTLFVSNKRGATLLQFDPPTMDSMILPNSTRIATINLSYVELDGTEYSQLLETIYNGPNIMHPDEYFYSQEGVQRTVVLTRHVVGMRDACAEYAGGNAESAIELLNQLRTYIYEQNDLLPEFELEREIELIDGLIANMGQ
jgi:Ca-activated chloride channel homolog